MPASTDLQNPETHRAHRAAASHMDAFPKALLNLPLPPMILQAETQAVELLLERKNFLKNI